MRKSGFSLLKLFFIATLVALSCRLFFIENYRIASASMFPMLLTGDIVFVQKNAFNVRLPFSAYELMKFDRPYRSEVVAFTLPDKGFETFVKRVVALEGDRVEIKNGKLLVNDELVAYTPVTDEWLASLRIPPAEKGKNWLLEQPVGGIPYVIQTEETPTAHYGPVDIPKNHFFAMGDNRNDSVDSRVWGPIPYSCLKGKVRLVWFSSDEKGNFRQRRTGLKVR